MIYRLRVILDTVEDIFRDIEIQSSSTLEDFHNVITQSFGFEGQEMASFYVSNDAWEQGQEIALFDMSEKPGEKRVMSDTILGDTLWEKQTKLIYVYDFLYMWTFMVELAEIVEPEPGMQYPNLMFAQGEIPLEALEPELKDANSDDEDDFDDDYGFDDYESLDFDENWN
ncbi:hypothetical protein SCB49_14155 [unidentified eubacterium SCB49]|nr:hypothetical protein SCB49_14155 [unidentified eubacterium SCB49]